MASKRLMLSPSERRELSRRLRSRSVRSEDARRADGHSPSMDLHEPNQSNRGIAVSSDTLH